MHLVDFHYKNTWRQVAALTCWCSLSNPKLTDQVHGTETSSVSWQSIKLSRNLYVLRNTKFHYSLRQNPPLNTSWLFWSCPHTPRIFLEIHFNVVGFMVPITVTVNMDIFWSVMPSRWVICCESSKRTAYLRRRVMTCWHDVDIW
jgi:hypothetical protein